MLPPDAEARFKKIEDDLAVTAELQRRAESRAKDDIEHLRAVQPAMARWQDQMAQRQVELTLRQAELTERQADFDAKMNALIDAPMRGEADAREMKQWIADASRPAAELSRKVDRVPEVPIGRRGTLRTRYTGDLDSG